MQHLRTIRALGVRPLLVWPLIAWICATSTVVGVALWASSDPVSAQPSPTESAPAAESAEAQIDIEVIVRALEPGDPLLVRVRARSPRAISGQLELGPRPNEWADPIRVSSEYRWDIDTAANTEVETLAAISIGWETDMLEARLVSDGSVIAERSVPVGFGMDGTFERIAALGIDAGARVDLIGGDGPASVASLADLPLTPATLDTFETVVADPAAIANLETAQRDVLAGWLLDGGQLALPNGADDLDAAGLSNLEPLRTASIVGDGFVAELGDTSTLDDDVLMTNGTAFREIDAGPRFGDPVAAMADRAGLELASVRSLAIFLGIYMIVAGPLAYALCRWLDRPRLMWVVVPAVAVVFSGIAALTSSVVRSAGHDEHTTIVMSQPVGSIAESYLLVRGGQDLAVDPDWWISPGTEGDMIRQGPGSVQFVIGAEQTTAAVNVSSGSAALLHAVGPIGDADNGLEITVATNDDQTITGSITNHLDVDLHDSIVVWDAGSVDIDTLAAGESQPFTIEYRPGPARQWQAKRPELEKWGVFRSSRNGMVNVVGPDMVAFDQGFGFEGDTIDEPKEGTVADGNIWELWRSAHGNLFNASSLVAIGWTDKLASPTGGIPTGRTAFVATAQAQSSQVPHHRMVAISVGFDEFFVEDAIVVDDMMVDDMMVDDMMGAPLLRSQYRIDFAEPISADDWALAIDRSVVGLAFDVDGTSRSMIFGPEDDGAIAVTFPDELDGATSVIVATEVRDGPIGFTSPTLTYRDPEAVPLKLSPNDDPIYRSVPFGGMAVPGPESDAFEPVDAVPGELVTVPPLANDEPYVVSGTVLRGTVNVYRIELNNAADLVVNMVATEDQLDPFLELRDPQGLPVASNDDDGTSRNSSMSYNSTVAGTYEIWASGLGAGGSYDLTINLYQEGDVVVPPAETETPSPTEPPAPVPTEAPDE